MSDFAEWDYYNETNKYYKVLEGQYYMGTARDNCRKICSSNGNLVSIPNEDTMNFIKQNAGLSSSAWIGGTKSNGAWTWMDGSAWNYTNWYSGEPDSSSILGMRDDYQWFDTSSSSSFKYAICQCDKQ